MIAIGCTESGSAGATVDSAEVVRAAANSTTQACPQRGQIAVVKVSYRPPQHFTFTPDTVFMRGAGRICFVKDPDSPVQDWTFAGGHIEEAERPRMDERSKVLIRRS